MAVLRPLLSNHEVEIAMLLPKMILHSKTTQEQRLALQQSLLDAGMERALCLLDTALLSLAALFQVRFVVLPENVGITHTSIRWSRSLGRFLEVGSTKKSTIRSPIMFVNPRLSVLLIFPIFAQT